VRGHVGDPVGVTDHALRVDQVGTPLRALGIPLVGMPFGLVPFRDLTALVRQETERELLILGECPIFLGSVVGDAQDLGTRSLELRGSITEPPPLRRSPGSVGLDEPPQHHPPAPEIGQGDGCAALVGQGELRRHRAISKHGRSVPAVG
jgi:hypothetical protein